MNAEYQTVRVSAKILSWLSDPFSVPKNQPHCVSCNTPKFERNVSCQVCGNKNAVTGTQPRGVNSNVFVEFYVPKKTVKVRRKTNATD